MNGPSKLETENNSITDQRTTCETLNSYFSNIGSTLINLIANTSTGNAAQTVIRNLTETATGTETELKYITLADEEEVIKIIDSFDPNTACIIDGISTKSLKCIKTCRNCRGSLNL